MHYERDATAPFKDAPLALTQWSVIGPVLINVARFRGHTTVVREEENEGII